MTAILEMRGISKSFRGREGAARRQLHRRGRRDPCPRRRERRRQVDADEGAERRLSPRHLRGRASSSRARSGTSATSTTARRSASSSSTRNWRWCRCCRSRRTSSFANEPSRFGVIDRDAVHRRTRELLAQVGLSEAPDTLITDIGVGKQQLVEIAKALSKEVQLLILDEPTASLNESDSEALLDLLLEFSEQGIVLDPDLAQAQRGGPRRRPHHGAARRPHRRDARLPERAGRGGPHHPQHGRTATSRTASRSAMPKIGEPVFEVKNWSVYHPLHAERQVDQECQLPCATGEVVGIAGLMGAGRTEFAMSLFGRSWGRKITGRVRIARPEADLSTVGRGDRRRPRLCHRGPQAARADAGRRRAQEHHAGQPRRRRARGGSSTTSGS